MPNLKVHFENSWTLTLNFKISLQSLKWLTQYLTKWQNSLANLNWLHHKKKKGELFEKTQKLFNLLKSTYIIQMAANFCGLILTTFHLILKVLMLNLSMFFRQKTSYQGLQQCAKVKMFQVDFSQLVIANCYQLSNVESLFSYH